VTQRVRSKRSDRSLAVVLRQYSRQAMFLVLGLLVAIPASLDAAKIWRRSQAIATRPSPQADPLLRLRWTESYVSDPRRFLDHAREVRQAAKQVLKAGPLSAPAMRQLGLLAMLEQPDAAGRELFQAERISRRDLPSQFALIEQASISDDLDGTLVHYDRALLVHPQASSQLYPVLAKAISDADVRAALHRYGDREWFGLFLNQGDRFAGDPLAVFALLYEMRGKLPAKVAQPAASTLLAQLVTQGQFGQARQLLRAIPDVQPAVLDTIGFSKATTDSRIAPLNWAIKASDAVETEIYGEALSISVAPERTALAAERTTLLAPGQYDLIQRVEYGEDGPRARLQWKVSCLDAAGAAIHESNEAPGNRLQATTWRIAVPASCPAQRWQLSASAELSQLPSTARITSLALVKR
jgi:hypothetical protein